MDRFAAQRERFRDSPFIVDVGIELVSLSDGEAEVALDVPHRLTNRVGGAHGGVIATIVDIVLAQAIRTRLGRTRLVATVEMKVNYLAPGRPGRLRAVARAVRVGGTLGTATCEVLDPGGSVIAIGSGTYRILGRATPPSA